MEDKSTTKVDIGVLDTTVSSNSSRDSSFPYLNQRPHHPVVKAIPADPVKSRCCLPPGRQRFVLILTLVALSALLAGGVFASVVIFEFNVYASETAFDEVFPAEYPEKADDDASYDDSEESVHPGDFLFMVNPKAAGHKAGEVIRLVNGASPSEGRVEIFYNGRWGTVCDDNFNINAANVVCRQLGFPSADDFHPWAHFGEGSGQIWLDNVRCTGAEPDIDFCRHRPWGNHNCGHYEDVGVTCTSNGPSEPVEVRIVGGSNGNDGRVEVNYNGQWGSVCDDSWTDEDAQVICRQLGLPHEGAVAVSEAFFGEGSGDILLDEVNCNGNEDNIGECQHQAWGVHDCQHYEDAGVICTDGSAPFEVRLVGGSSPNQGRVEVRYNGVWGTVCDDSWGTADANVVCRQLGYTGAGHQALSYASFGEGSGSILMDEVACSGGEASLEYCLFNGWNVHDCQHHEDASVICATGEDLTEVRLVGGSNPNEGRVEIRYNGVWGTICDDQWSDVNAQVVCQHLGLPYGGAEGTSNAQFGQGAGQIWLDDVNCAGSESSVADCQHRPWGNHNCGHNEDAGVVCQDAPLPATDNVDPEISSCPPNQPTSGLIYAFSGQTATYRFPDAQATDVNDLDQSTTPVISYTIQTPNPQTSQESTGQFPIGTTSVTVTATDSSGNQASCSFTVTVTESTASGPWEMLAQQCGRPSLQRNTRIVNGEAVSDIRYWPWAASISNQYFCGAELISENWAITAAHCIHGQTSSGSSPTQLTIGRLNINEIPDTAHQTDVQIFEHPRYNPQTTNNDIALLKLESPVTFSDYVRPVCLATSSNEWATYPEEQASCHVIGWGTLSSGGGSPNTLQEVDSPLITQSQCRSYYSASGITDNMICTSTTRQTGSCQGDSGGPMMCKNANGIWDLVGITSWGRGCADPRYPDVMARVSTFNSWVRDTVDSNGGP